MGRKKEGGMDPDGGKTIVREEKGKKQAGRGTKIEKQ